jgi:hypothetical protein
MNIIAQDISTRIYTQDYSLFVSVLIGTATGLIIKYLLDKKIIFIYQTQNILHDTRIFYHLCSDGHCYNINILGN